MEVNSRRGFLKGFSLIGAVVGGAVATKVVVEHKTEQIVAPVSAPTIDPSVVALIEEQSPANMQLTSVYGEIQPPPPPPPPTKGMVFTNSGDGYISYTPNLGSLTIHNPSRQFVPGTENHVSVKMVPGPDGELYINIKGKWKRVITT